MVVRPWTLVGGREREVDCSYLTWFVLYKSKEEGAATTGLVGRSCGSGWFVVGTNLVSSRCKGPCCVLLVRSGGRRVGVEGG